VYGQHSPGIDTVPPPEIYANSYGAEALPGSYLRVTANIHDGNKDRSFMYNIE